MILKFYNIIEPLSNNYYDLEGDTFPAWGQSNDGQFFKLNKSYTIKEKTYEPGIYQYLYNETIQWNLRNDWTWGDAIIEIRCKEVFLKEESLIEEIISKDPENPTKKNPLNNAYGKSNIIIEDGIYYLAQYKQYYRYIGSKSNKTVSLTKVNLDELEPYEKVAGLYKYNLRVLQQLIYSKSDFIGFAQVSQNYWKIEVTNESEDDEYFYFNRTWTHLKDEYNISKITEKKEIDEAIKQDTTLMAAYSALKKAVALAEFYCTCLPIIDTVAGGTSDDFNFINLYTRKTEGDVKVKLKKYYEKFDLKNYSKGFTIDPQTHVMKLGIANLEEVDYIKPEIIEVPALPTAGEGYLIKYYHLTVEQTIGDKIYENGYYQCFNTGTKEVPTYEWQKSNPRLDTPLPYFVIRDYYRNATGLLIARQSKVEGEDYPSDIHFEQLMHKVNTTFDFNIPIEAQTTNPTSAVHKSYIYDNIINQWVETEELDLFEYGSYL